MGREKDITKRVRKPRETTPGHLSLFEAFSTPWLAQWVGSFQALTGPLHLSHRKLPHVFGRQRRLQGRNPHQGGVPNKSNNTLGNETPNVHTLAFDSLSYLFLQRISICTVELRLKIEHITSRNFPRWTFRRGNTGNMRREA